MKNILIGVLSVALVIVGLREFQRPPARVDVAEQFREPPKKTGAPLERVTQSVGYQLNTEDRRSSENQSAHEAQLSVQRWEVLKLNCMLYSRYFATHNLPEDKASMVLELLVDRMFIASESEIQGNQTIQAGFDKNNKMIEELIGAGSVAELESAKNTYIEGRSVQKAVDGILGLESANIPEREVIADAVRQFRPSQGISTHMSEKGPLSLSDESLLRTEYQKRINGQIRQLAPHLESSQVIKFRAWSDGEFEKSIEFLKMIRSANAGS